MRFERFRNYSIPVFSVVYASYGYSPYDTFKDGPMSTWIYISQPNSAATITLEIAGEDCLTEFCKWINQFVSFDLDGSKFCNTEVKTVDDGDSVSVTTTTGNTTKTVKLIKSKEETNL